MKNIVLVILLTASSFLGIAQVNNLENTTVITESSTAPQQVEYDGTYLVEMTKRGMPYIPVEINEIVAEHRQDETVAYFYLSEYVRVKVLSRSEINSSSFIPFTNHVVVVSSFTE